MSVVTTFLLLLPALLGGPGGGLSPSLAGLVDPGARISRPRGGVDLITLGLKSRPADIMTLLAMVARPAPEGPAAVLALGLHKNHGCLGHLKGLFLDRVTGRSLAGKVWQRVPSALRGAAALALGCSGRPEARRALRRAVKRGDLPDSLDDVARLALVFQADPKAGRDLLGKKGLLPLTPLQTAVLFAGTHILRELAPRGGHERTLASRLPPLQLQLFVPLLELTQRSELK